MGAVLSVTVEDQRLQKLNAILHGLLDALAHRRGYVVNPTTAATAIHIRNVAIDKASSRRGRLLALAFGSCGSHLSVERGLKLHHPEHMALGGGIRIGARMRLQCVVEYAGRTYRPQLKVGDRVSFEDDCHVACADTVVIEGRVLIASNVFISDHRHSSDDPSLAIRDQGLVTGRVDIGEGAHLGRNVVVLGPVSIGEGTVVGANSVVTKDLPPFTVAAGAPARVIRYLKSVDGASRPRA